MPISIRNAVPADTAVIIEFNRRLAWETEEKELDLPTLSKGVAAALSDPAKGFYLVAENAAGEVVGQLAITLEWSDWRNGWFWWLQSVYVRADHRRQGVFNALTEAVLERARAAGDVIGLRLYVEDENHPAQETYKRLGFQRLSYQFFERYPLG